MWNSLEMNANENNILNLEEYSQDSVKRRVYSNKYPMTNWKSVKWKTKKCVSRIWKNKNKSNPKVKGKKYLKLERK